MKLVNLFFVSLKGCWDWCMSLFPHIWNIYSILAIISIIIILEMKASHTVFRRLIRKKLNQNGLKERKKMHYRERRIPIITVIAFLSIYMAAMTFETLIVIPVILIIGFICGICIGEIKARVLILKKKREILY